MYTLEKHTSQRLSQYTHVVHTETQTFTGCEDETDIYKTSQAEGGDVVPCVHFQRALLYVLHPAVGSGDGGNSHKEIRFVSFSKLKSS